MPASKHRCKGRPRTQLNSKTEPTKPTVPPLDEQLQDEHFRDGIRALLNEVENEKALKALQRSLIAAKRRG
jgi:hypothetical protein